jgi:hypothetical protein
VKPAPECRVSWNQVAAFRLLRQQLAGGAKRTPAELARELNGVQAQVLKAAELSLRVRAENITAQGVRSALWQDRSLVRTSAMRQTLHLLPSADFSLYISALRSSRMAALMRVISRFGINAREVEAFNESAVGVLKSGPRTRRDLMAELRKQSGKKVRAWIDAVWSPVRTAMVEGLICYGEDQGREPALVRTDQWLGRFKPMAEEQAQQILLERYLKACGPATTKDFAYWSGMPAREAASVWTSLADRMAGVSLEGQKLFILAEDLKVLRESELREPVVRLLPHFDAYLLAHAEKDHLVETRHYKRVFRSQWWISPVVLLNGKIIGTWARVESGKGTTIKTELFGKVTGATRLRLEEEVERVNRLLSPSRREEAKKPER